MPAMTRTLLGPAFALCLAAGAALGATAPALHAQHLYAEGQAAQWRGEYARSLELLLEVERASPDLYLARFLIGFALQKLGRDQEAVEQYRAFLPGHPDHAQAHFNLGYALMQLGNYRDASASFERTLALQPEYREVHLHLGRCLEKLGQATEAARHLAIWKRE